MFEKLTAKDLKLINDTTSSLLKIENPHLFRKIALEKIVKILSIKGYSTILWMNRFYSKVKRNGQRGKVYGEPIHINNPPNWLKKLYKTYIEKSDSIIEQEVYRRFPNEDLGFVVLHELLDKDLVMRDRLGWLARRAGIGEMSYLWLNITENDMWVFCLRKFIDEPKFTERDALIAKAIGEKILDIRRKWWLQETIKPLSERELEVFDLYCCQGLTKVEVAEMLRISDETVKSHVINYRNKMKELTRYIGRVEKSLSKRHLTILTPRQRIILKLLSEDRT